MAMKIVATMLVRNEEWVLRASLRTALKWADEVIVLNHGSIDDTAGILSRAFAQTGRVFHRNIEAGESWEEMDLRHELLVWARSRDATHVALVDADEILTENLVPKVRRYAEQLKPKQTLRMPMIAPWGDLDHYRDDRSAWSVANTFLLVCDHPDIRWHANKSGYQLHHREPYGITEPTYLADSKKEGGFFHLQWASWRRLVAKHVWYQMMERLRYPEKPVKHIAAQYSQAPQDKKTRRSKVPQNFWDPETKKLIDLEHVPWHEQEVARLIERHGRETFRGLNFMGVI